MKNVHSKNDVWHFHEKTKVNDSHTLYVSIMCLSKYKCCYETELTFAGLGRVLLQTYIAKFNEDTSYSCSTLILK